MPGPVLKLLLNKFLNLLFLLSINLADSDCQIYITSLDFYEFWFKSDSTWYRIVILWVPASQTQQLDYKLGKLSRCDNSVIKMLLNPCSCVLARPRSLRWCVPRPSRILHARPSKCRTPRPSTYLRTPALEVSRPRSVACPGPLAVLSFTGLATFSRIHES